jgi:hypothetical protein
MIRNYVPEDVWQVMDELSFFFCQHCAKEIDQLVISSMERKAAMLLSSYVALQLRENLYTCLL